MSSALPSVADVIVAPDTAIEVARKPSDTKASIGLAAVRATPAPPDLVIRKGSAAKKWFIVATIIVGFMLTIAWAGFLLWLSLHALGLL